MEKHGMYGTPEYKSWSEMKQRCLNPKMAAYDDYGGRGITIYGPWIDSFTEFYKYVGPRPAPGYTLDRINNNGNYEPGNVRWASKATQAANRRNTKFYDFHGHRLMAHEIDAHLGSRQGVVHRLLKRGYMLEEIVEDIRFSLNRLYQPTHKPFSRLSVEWKGRTWTVDELAQHFDVPYGKVYALLKRHKGSSVEYMIDILSGVTRDRRDRVRVGDVFGKLTVIAAAAPRPKKWTVRCSCGTSDDYDVHQSNLVSGHTKSCGCLRFSTHQYS